MVIRFCRPLADSEACVIVKSGERPDGLFQFFQTMDAILPTWNAKLCFEITISVQNLQKEEAAPQLPVLLSLGITISA